MKIKIPPAKLTFDEIMALADSIEFAFGVELSQVGPNFIEFEKYDD